MTNEKFLAEFGHIADAPGGVARLRGLILDLAVRGRLVPQDPDDEPASVLLERIAAERELLVSEKKLKKGKPLAAIDLDDEPYKPPMGWAWARLDEACCVIMGSSPKSETFTGSPLDGVPFLQGNAEFGLLNPTPTKGTTSPVRMSPARAVLISVRAPVGATNITLAEVCIGRGLASLVPLADTPLQFLFWMMRAFSRKLADGARGTTFPAVTAPVLRNFPVPVPPLTEQQRIVARVDELMALCDELEEGQTKAAELRVATTRSTLARIIDSDLAETDDAVALINDHLRLALEPGTGAAEVVTELRKAILDLAVRGRLVPQDPADEPASVLLERIAEERERLVAEKKIKKGKPLTPVKEDHELHPIPDSWAWTRLEFPYEFLNGRAFKPEEWGDSGLRIIRIQNISDPNARASRFAGAVDPKHIIESGDLLLSWSATLRASIWTGGKAVLNQHIFRVDSVGGAVNTRFSQVALTALIQEMSRQAHGSAMQHVTKAALVQIPVAVPPSAEQQRIVARVDELMALCDELEEGLLAERRVAGEFADSAVSALVAQVS